jgi:hypothetical protein
MDMVMLEREEIAAIDQLAQPPHVQESRCVLAMEHAAVLLATDVNAKLEEVDPTVH